MNFQDYIHPFNRRSLLKLTGFAIIIPIANFLSACTTLQNEDRELSSQKQATQYAFWMNSMACIGCGECVTACRNMNNTSDEYDARRKLILYEFEENVSKYVSVSCMHCSQPTCLQVCPAKAISKRSDGIVIVDQSRCIGCKYCYQACPFGVPRYTSSGMDKCDCCLGIGVKAGQDPYCIKACPSGALKFGTLESLLEQADEGARQLDAPTEPSFLLS